MCLHDDPSSMYLALNAYCIKFSCDQKNVCCNILGGDVSLFPIFFSVIHSLAVKQIEFDS